MYNITLRHIQVTTVAVEKQNYILCVFVCVALVIQHSLHMHHTVIHGTLHSTVFFSTLSHKLHHFQKKSY